MDFLRAHTLSALYRMRAHLLPHRPRLDRICRDMAQDWLEDALNRHGFFPTELICLKRVNCRVRLRLDHFDNSLAAAWADSLAQSIRFAIDAGSTDVVRYSSRAHALTDLLERSVAHRWERVWAWQALGFPIGSAIPLSSEAILAAVLTEPQLIVPVLTAVIRRHDADS